MSNAIEMAVAITAWALAIGVAGAVTIGLVVIVSLIPLAYRHAKEDIEQTRSTNVD